MEFQYLTDWWECIQDRVTQGLLPSSSFGLGLVYWWWIWRMRNDFVIIGIKWAQGGYHELMEANVKIPSILWRTVPAENRTQV